MEVQIDYTIERPALDGKGNPILDDQGVEVSREVDLTITGDVEAYHRATWHHPEEGGNAYITKIEEHEESGIVEHDDDFLCPKETEDVEDMLYTAAEEDDSHCDHRW